MYPRPVTGGRYQGQVGCPIGSQGTMGRPEVPVDILWQKWNYYFGNAMN